MTARTKYIVHYGNARLARFSDQDDALNYARWISETWNGVECIAPDGLIGQFLNGRATPEFARLDQAWHANKE